jgi:hypothetical protein
MKSVRIGAHKYPIVYVDKVDDEDSWGNADFHDYKILLSKALEKPELASVWAEKLLHEVAHIMLDDLGVEFPTEEAEEKCVTQLARGLTQFTRDNKTLIRQILKALK